MMNTTIETIQNNINAHLNLNMQIQNNQYGARVGLDFKDKWLTMKFPTKLTDSLERVILEYPNGQNGRPEYRTVSQQNFSRFFDTSNYSYADLLNDLINGQKLIKAEHVREAQNKTAATMMLMGTSEGDVEYRSKSFEMFSTGRFRNEYTQADKDYFYSKIFRDESGNFYINLENKLWRLDFKTGTERQVQGNTMDADTNFWPSFFRVFNNDIQKWNEIISLKLTDYDWDKNNQTSIEEYLMNSGIPRIYLECLIIVRTERGEKSEGDRGGVHINWYLEKIDVGLNTGTKSTAWTYENQINTFSKKIFQSVDATKVKLIPIFSNNPDEIAVKHLPKLLPKKCEKAPKLPPNWGKFLSDKRFFDPVMDKMKIACFVHNTYSAKYTGRQVLVIGGEGQDGKGTFLETIRTILGNDYACTCKPQDFDGEKEFGLSKIINKKLICIPDCKTVSKLFGYDDFKSVTGSDTMDINRKYLNSIRYLPKGVTVAVCTNKPFYVIGAHGMTRALPLVFKKNYSLADYVEKDEMIRVLMSEKEEFIQWCEDYRMFLNSRCNGKLLKGDLLRLCPDKMLKDLANLDISTEDAADKEYEFFKAACRNQTLDGTIFCSWNPRLEEAEAAEEDLMEIFDEYLLKFMKDKGYQKDLELDYDENKHPYMQLSKFIIWINRYMMNVDNTFYKSISTYYDVRGGIKNHPKNEICTALKNWLENRGCQYYNRTVVNGESIRKVYDIYNLLNIEIKPDETDRMVESYATISKDVSKMDEYMNQVDTSKGITWAEVQKNKVETPDEREARIRKEIEQEKAELTGNVDGDEFTRNLV